MGKIVRRNKSLIVLFLMLILSSAWVVRRDTETFQTFFFNMGAEWLFFTLSAHFLLYVGWLAAIMAAVLIWREMDPIRMLLRGGRTQAVGYQIKSLMRCGFLAAFSVTAVFTLQTWNILRGSVSAFRYVGFLLFLYAQLELIFGAILYLRWRTGQFVWGFMMMLAFAKWIQLRSPLFFCFSFLTDQPIKIAGIAVLAVLCYMAALRRAKYKDLIPRT